MAGILGARKRLLIAHAIYRSGEFYYALNVKIQAVIPSQLRVQIRW